MANNLTNEQLYAFLSMSDLDAQEKRLAQQQAMANELRKESMQPKAGGGWAGGLASGLQGAMSGYQQKQANESLDKLSAERSKTLKQMMPMFTGQQGQNLPIAPPPAAIDYSQYDPKKLDEMLQNY